MVERREDHFTEPLERKKWLAIRCVREKVFANHGAALEDRRADSNMSRQVAVAIEKHERRSCDLQADQTCKHEVWYRGNQERPAAALIVGNCYREETHFRKSPKTSRILPAQAGLQAKVVADGLWQYVRRPGYYQRLIDCRCVLPSATRSRPCAGLRRSAVTNHPLLRTRSIPSNQRGNPASDEQYRSWFWYWSR